ncbi:hypothetical protein EGR_08279 [Echinococcus granulosus]|uniref:Uncharacterized protein n=1 Tax=Echinococcus granulosus TaxID=6210 RepID=W6U6K3_ECHGR|nr:hypothetical protein EGR_08279 [Echinococcus granulosus]EUB56873.1 hypothetical protein EGR_08279 [Echinococcus granulosus]
MPAVVDIDELQVEEEEEGEKKVAKEGDIENKNVVVERLKSRFLNFYWYRLAEKEAVLNIFPNSEKSSGDVVVDGDASSVSKVSLEDDCVLETAFSRSQLFTSNRDVKAHATHENQLSNIKVAIASTFMHKKLTVTQLIDEFVHSLFLIVEPWVFKNSVFAGENSFKTHLIIFVLVIKSADLKHAEKKMRYKRISL